MPQNSRFFIGIFLMAAVACVNKAGTDKTVARVGDKILFLSEVNNFVPNGISPSDSTLMAGDYIKKWIQKELLIRKAEENLTTEQMDVSKELQEYRNSLIIYRYKNELVAQKMDTTVLESEILKYYNENLETFRLNRNIVKAAFLKIPLEFANPNELKLYCGNKSDENFKDLREYCLRFAKSFDTFNNSWVEFYRVINNFPVQLDDSRESLLKNEIFETSDSEFYYLVCVREFIPQGETAPVEFVQDQIENLILNKRKLNFLKNVETDVYNDGVRNNKFNIYDVN